MVFSPELALEAEEDYSCRDSQVLYARILVLPRSEHVSSLSSVAITATTIPTANYKSTFYFTGVRRRGGCFVLTGSSIASVDSGSGCSRIVYFPTQVIRDWQLISSNRLVNCIQRPGARSRNRGSALALTKLQNIVLLVVTHPHLTIDVGRCRSLQTDIQCCRNAHLVHSLRRSSSIDVALYSHCTGDSELMAITSLMWSCKTTGGRIMTIMGA